MRGLTRRQRDASVIAQTDQTTQSSRTADPGREWAGEKVEEGERRKQGRGGERRGKEGKIGYGKQKRMV